MTTSGATFTDEQKQRAYAICGDTIAGRCIVDSVIDALVAEPEPSTLEELAIEWTNHYLNTQGLKDSSYGAVTRYVVEQLTALTTEELRRLGLGGE